MYSSRQKGEFVTPKAVLQLMTQLGPTKAARQLGVSPTTLYKARRGGEVSRVYEVAASGILGQPAAAAKPAKTVFQTEMAPNEERALLMVEVPKERVNLIRRAVTAVGGEVMY